MSTLEQQESEKPNIQRLVEVIHAYAVDTINATMSNEDRRKRFYARLDNIGIADKFDWRNENAK